LADIVATQSANLAQLGSTIALRRLRSEARRIAWSIFVSAM
jgi:hypothetical protein